MGKGNKNGTPVIPSVTHTRWVDTHFRRRQCESREQPTNLMTATREKQKRYFVVSFDCRSFVVRLSVVCRSVVVRLSFGCRSVVARLSRFVVRLSLVCRSTVARLKKCCRSVVVRLSFGLKIIISKLSFDCRSIVVRLLLDCGGGCRTMSFVVARLPSLPRMTAAPRHSVCRPVTPTHDSSTQALSLSAGYTHTRRKGPVSLSVVSFFLQKLSLPPQLLLLFCFLCFPFLSQQPQPLFNNSPWLA